MEDMDCFCWACRLVACFLREDGPGAPVRRRAEEAGAIEVLSLTRFTLH